MPKAESVRFGLALFPLAAQSAIGVGEEQEGLPVFVTLACLLAGGPVTAPGLREIVSYPPGLSTMRSGAGRLRYVVLACGPARRLTFCIRAGEDAVRSRLPTYTRSSIRPPETPK